MRFAATVEPCCRGCGAVGLERVVAAGAATVLLGRCCACRLLQRLGPPDADDDVDLSAAAESPRADRAVASARADGADASATSAADEDSAAADALARRLIAERRLGPDSLAVEIAGEHERLPRAYRHAGVPSLGVLPPEGGDGDAAPSAHDLRARAHRFDATLAGHLRDAGLRADVLHVGAALAHAPDLDGFVAALARLLADDGLLVARIACPRSAPDAARGDAAPLYHFTLTALAHILRRHGLALEDCEPAGAHGDALRLFARHAAVAAPSDRLRRALAIDHD